MDLARIVVHKKGLEIDNIHYVCEISYNRKGFFISLFSIFTHNQCLALHLKYGERTDAILKNFNHDFGLLAKSLRLKDGKIKIETQFDEYETETENVRNNSKSKADSIKNSNKMTIVPLNLSTKNLRLSKVNEYNSNSHSPRIKNMIKSS